MKLHVPLSLSLWIFSASALNLNITKTCEDQLKGITDLFTVVKSIDAWGKPVGIMEGAFTSLGDYGECQKLKNAGTDSFSYVLVDGILKITKPIEASLGSALGICVPDKCTSFQDITGIMSVIRASPEVPKDSLYLETVQSVMWPFFAFSDPMVKYYIQDVHEAKPSPWSAGDIAYLCVLGLIGLLVLVATMIDYVHESTMFKKCPVLDLDLEEEEPLILSSKEVPVPFTAPPKRKSKFAKAIRSFSLYVNLESLFRAPNPKSAELNCLNTIRAISMWWVVLGHVVGIYLERAPVDVLSLLDVAKRFPFVVVLNAFFSVDSFFFLSAFLLTYIVFKTDAMAKFNYIKYVVFRYLRLTFSYAVVLFGWFLLYPHLGEGPLWWAKQEENPRKCMNFWWSHLLYLNELLPTLMDDSCMSWGWYLAADFHLYMVSPIFIYVLYKCKSKWSKITSFAIAFIACGALTISSSYIQNVPAIATPVASDFDVGRSRREHKQWLADFYQKPWNHLTVYIVGILCGYLAFKRKSALDIGKSNVKPLNHLIITVMQVLGLVLMFGTLFLPYNFTHDLTRWSNLGNAMYNYFSRVTWSLGIALFIFPSVTQPQDTHLLTKFWSWNGWNVMGKLTYGVYLVHIIMIQILVSAKTRATPFQGVEIAFIVGGTLFWSYLVSFILFLSVEAPFGGLVKLLTR